MNEANNTKQYEIMYLGSIERYSTYMPKATVDKIFADKIGSLVWDANLSFSPLWLIAKVHLSAILYTIKIIALKRVSKHILKRYYHKRISLQSLHTIIS